jgi:hypothetical protein
MGNTETYLRVPPKQSSFGPWYYAAQEDGLGDKAFVGVLAFFVSFAFIELILLFGLFSEVKNIKDKKKRSEFINRTILRYAAIFFMIFLGWAILGASFSYTWRQATLEGDLLYRVGLAERVPMRLGLHVGLRGVNITLVYTGTPGTNRFRHGNGLVEIIQYNEQYLWSRGQGQIGGWLIGRFGFGPYSNLLAQQFRAAQFRGTPWPIIETLEWLTLDGESIRWHRWYHVGGYYAHVYLWLAFVTWILTGITTVMDPKTGMFWLGMTGFLQWFAAANYHGLTEKAHPALAIPFEGHFLEPTFGWAYYLTLVVGIIVNLMAIIGWYIFSKVGYTTTAFSLKSTCDRPAEIIRQPIEEPLEEVVSSADAVKPVRGKVSGERGTFRRGRSTFGSRRSTRGGNVRPSLNATGPARGPSKFGGRSSRRTKKAFGKSLSTSVSDSSPHGLSRGAQKGGPSLADLGNKLDGIVETELDAIQEGDELYEAVVDDGPQVHHFETDEASVDV